MEQITGTIKNTSTDDLEQLLSEAEDTLYFVSSAINLARIADYDKYAADIYGVLEKASDIAESLRERITETLVLQHCQ